MVETTRKLRYAAEDAVKALTDRARDLEYAIQDAIDTLVDADYTDGNHPVIEDLLTDLRLTLFPDENNEEGSA